TPTRSGRSARAPAARPPSPGPPPPPRPAAPPERDSEPARVDSRGPLPYAPPDGGSPHAAELAPDHRRRRVYPGGSGDGRLRRLRPDPDRLGRGSRRAHRSVRQEPDDRTDRGG